jgi:hypothetical protein
VPIKAPNILRPRSLSADRRRRLAWLGDSASTSFPEGEIARLVVGEEGERDGSRSGSLGGSESAWMLGDGDGDK